MSHDKQHTLFLLAAMSAPLGLCVGSGWGIILIAGTIFLPLTCLPQRWEGMGRTHCMIQAVWMGVILGVLLKNVSAFWPSHEGKMAPLVLLALASCTQNGAAVGAVLAFCLFGLYLPVCVMGAMHLEPAWAVPAFEKVTPMLPVILLLPALFQAEKRGKGAIWTAFMGIALSVLTQGILSVQVAGRVDAPVYEMARTLRIEPVIAVAVTLGWYILSAGILERSGMRIVTALIAAAMVLWEPGIEGIWMVIPCLILWVIVPFVRSENFFKKSEKRC